MRPTSANNQPEEGSSEEDITDELFAKRHRTYEVKERARWSLPEKKKKKMEEEKIHVPDQLLVTSANECGEKIGLSNSSPSIPTSVLFPPTQFPSVPTTPSPFPPRVFSPPLPATPQSSSPSPSITPSTSTNTTPQKPVGKVPPKRKRVDVKTNGAKKPKTSPKEKTSESPVPTNPRSEWEVLKDKSLPVDPQTNQKKLVIFFRKKPKDADDMTTDPPSTSSTITTTTTQSTSSEPISATSTPTRAPVSIIVNSTTTVPNFTPTVAAVRPAIAALSCLPNNPVQQISLLPSLSLPPLPSFIHSNHSTLHSSPSSPPGPVQQLAPSTQQPSPTRILNNLIRLKLPLTSTHSSSPSPLNSTSPLPVSTQKSTADAIDVNHKKILSTDQPTAVTTTPME